MAQRKYKSSQDNKQKTMRHLESFMLDGRLEIINNDGERAIKPFVIGRRTFLLPTLPKEQLPAHEFKALWKLQKPMV